MTDQPQPPPADQIVLHAQQRVVTIPFRHPIIVEPFQIPISFALIKQLAAQIVLAESVNELQQLQQQERTTSRIIMPT